MIVIKLSHIVLHYDYQREKIVMKTKNTNTIRISKNYNHFKVHCFQFHPPHHQSKRLWSFSKNLFCICKNYFMIIPKKRDRSCESENSTSENFKIQSDIFNTFSFYKSSWSTKHFQIHTYLLLQ